MKVFVNVISVFYSLQCAMENSIKELLIMALTVRAFVKFHVQHENIQPHVAMVHKKSYNVICREWNEMEMGIQIFLCSSYIFRHKNHMPKCITFELWNIHEKDQVLLLYTRKWRYFFPFMNDRMCVPFNQNW